MSMTDIKLSKRQRSRAALQRNPDWRKMKQTNKKNPGQTNVRLSGFMKLTNCSPYCHRARPFGGYIDILWPTSFIVLRNEQTPSYFSILFALLFIPFLLFAMGNENGQMSITGVRDSAKSQGKTENVVFKKAVKKSHS